MPKLITSAHRVGLPYPPLARPDPAAIDRALALTRDPEPRVRQAALTNLCACHVKSDRRLDLGSCLALAADPDARVPQQVLHNLIDGSPERVAEQAASCVASLWNDPAPKIRKQARAILQRYRRTGRINAPGAK
jgi:hypothetical protein